MDNSSVILPIDSTDSQIPWVYDVYGEKIPNTSLFNTTWYIYLIMVLIGTAADTYLTGMVTVFLCMQRSLVGCTYTILFIFFLYLSAIPMAVVHWFILLKKNTFCMIMGIMISGFSILYEVFLAIIDAKEMGINELTDFVYRGGWVTVVIRGWLVGGRLISIAVVALLLNEMIRLRRQEGIATVW